MNYTKNGRSGGLGGYKDKTTPVLSSKAQPARLPYLDPYYLASLAASPRRLHCIDISL